MEQTVIRKNRMARRGFTLVEILCAAFVFLIVLGIIASMFSSLSRSYFKGNARIRLQNNLRTSLDIMSAEIRECYDNGTISVNPGPLEGSEITFNKRDERKKRLLRVDYSFDSSSGTIQRTDYDDSSGTLLSTASIGERITGVIFTYDAAGGRVSMSISGNDPDYPGVGSINLMTSVTLRSGAELLTVKYLGKSTETGRSSLIRAGE